MKTLLKMKKAIIKNTLVAVAVTASCFGATKAFSCYVTPYNPLFEENLLALGETPVRNGEVYVRVYSRPCYIDKIVGKVKVQDPSKSYSTTGYYWKYHHKQEMYYYQVCVHKDYKVAAQWDLCDESKVIGKSWCIGQGGSLEPLESKDYWSY